MAQKYCGACGKRLEVTPMSEALWNFGDAIEQLDTDGLTIELAMIAKILMNHPDPATDPAMFNYHRAIHEALLAECPRRGISADEALRYGEDLSQELQKNIALDSAALPTPKVQ